MILQDLNQSWKPPEGYAFQSIIPLGSYLQVTYHQKVYASGTRKHIRTDVVVVYLNDQGREVSRTNAQHLVIEFEPSVKKQDTTSAWVRFKNGFFMVLIGLEEMIKCRRNS